MLADGPVAYWRLDESARTTGADIAGHASGPLNGTYTSAPTLGAAGVMDDGSGDTAVNFGGGSHVLGADWNVLELLNLAPFTVQAWVKPESLTL